MANNSRIYKMKKNTQAIEALGIVHLQNVETSEFRKLLNIVKTTQIKKPFIHTANKERQPLESALKTSAN